MLSFEFERLPRDEEFDVTEECRQSYDENGFVVVRNFFTESELKNIQSCIESSQDIRNHSFGREDREGFKSRMCMWNKAGNDVLGIVSRSQKVAGTLQALMGEDEIYHYHSKLMMKEAFTGGAFMWHQDYGYWYHNGCLLPEMGSVFIPIDRCTRSNGCLQVLRGSHQMGRIEHKLIADQAGADVERVEHAKEMFEHLYLEMEAGDILFFHCNLLHTSSKNSSPDRRYVLISSYNKKKNNPVKVHHCPMYHPLNIVPSSEIAKCSNMNSDMDKDFMNPSAKTTFQSIKRNQQKSIE